MEVLRPIHFLSDLIREYKLSSIDLEEFLKRLLEKLQMAKCGKIECEVALHEFIKIINDSKTEDKVVLKYLSEILITTYNKLRKFIYVENKLNVKPLQIQRKFQNTEWENKFFNSIIVMFDGPRNLNADSLYFYILRSIIPDESIGSIMETLFQDTELRNIGTNNSIIIEFYKTALEWSFDSLEDRHIQFILYNLYESFKNKYLEKSLKVTETLESAFQKCRREKLEISMIKNLFEKNPSEIEILKFQIFNKIKSEDFLDIKDFKLYLEFLNVYLKDSFSEIVSEIKKLLDSELDNIKRANILRFLGKLLKTNEVDSQENTDISSIFSSHIIHNQEIINICMVHFLEFSKFIPYEGFLVNALLLFSQEEIESKRYSKIYLNLVGDVFEFFYGKLNEFSKTRILKSFMKYWKHLEYEIIAQNTLITYPEEICRIFRSMDFKDLKLLILESIEDKDNIQYDKLVCILRIVFKDPSFDQEFLKEVVFKILGTNIKKAGTLSVDSLHVFLFRKFSEFTISIYEKESKYKKNLEDLFIGFFNPIRYEFNFEDFIKFLNIMNPDRLGKDILDILSNSKFDFLDIVDIYYSNSNRLSRKYQNDFIELIKKKFLKDFKNIYEPIENNRLFSKNDDKVSKQLDENILRWFKYSLNKNYDEIHRTTYFFISQVQGYSKTRNKAKLWYFSNKYYDRFKGILLEKIQEIIDQDNDDLEFYWRIICKNVGNPAECKKILEEMHHNKNIFLYKANRILHHHKHNKKPGIAIIFHNYIWPYGEIRHGSEHDIELLKTTFELYSIFTLVVQNPTFDDIIHVIKKLNEINFTNISCLIIGVLSHGERFDQVRAKDKIYKITDHIIYPLINGNPTLRDTVKFLFVQACKGNVRINSRKNIQSEDQKSDELGIYRNNEEKYSVIDEEYNTIELDTTIPKREILQFIRLDSTFEGFASVRLKTIGTPFIRSLCEAIQEFGEIKTLEEIAFITRKKTFEMIGNLGIVQCPPITSNILNDIILGEYGLLEELIYPNTENIDEFFIILKELLISRSQFEIESPMFSQEQEIKKTFMRNGIFLKKSFINLDISRP